ncbi:MAG: GTP-binding protein [Candidatus Thorarchaeota archaeon]|nr:GTP-binding protein [Candidatus Thorarchaeota archaeon]
MLEGIPLPQDSSRYMFKMVSLGDAGVGKTSCILRYTENSFGDVYRATLGTNLAIKNLIVETPNGETASAQVVIWDLGGQPSFRELRIRYMTGASLAFLVYDVTSPSSFLNLQNWYDNFIEINPKASIAVVANKIDLKDRKVPPEAGRMIKKWWKVPHVETSAKTGLNVESLFRDLIQDGIKRRHQMERKKQSK